MSTTNTIDAVRRQNELAGTSQKDVDLATLDAVTKLPAEYPGWMLERQRGNRA